MINENYIKSINKETIRNISFFLKVRAIFSLWRERPFLCKLGFHKLTYEDIFFELDEGLPDIVVFYCRKCKTGVAGMFFEDLPVTVQEEIKNLIGE